MAPRGETTIAGGDEVFVVGPGQQLRAFREAVA
jgi:Trk K+ transport system NAD-binding subunit